MAYDERLADRIRAILGDRGDVSERKMFGGLAFLLGGHMCCGIVGTDLMVRVGEDAFEKAVSAPHARPMDFTGRPSTGMVYVAPAGVKTAASLRKWVAKGIDFASRLPAGEGSRAAKGKASKPKAVVVGRKDAAVSTARSARAAPPVAHDPRVAK